MADTKKPAKPELDTEVANRLRDPFEVNYMGVLRTNDPLLLERGNGASAFKLYRDLKRDGKVFSGLQKRRLAVLAKPWQVEPITDDAAGKASADACTKMLKSINFDTLTGELLEALLVGFVPAEIVWTSSSESNMIGVARVIKRAQRRFVYVQENEHEPPALRLLTRSNMLSGEPVPDNKFMVHRVNPEDDNPYGTGLGLQLYWPVFFKRKGILSWNKLCDRFGSPTPWGKYPKGASTKEKGTLFDALKAMSNDGVIMTPEGMGLELLESKLTGSITTQQGLCEYMDDWISEVLLGQSPRSKSGGAMAAASNEREDVRMELSQADSDLVSETINSTLLKWFCEYNGLALCRVYRVIKKDKDLKQASEVDKNVSEMGFEMTEEGVQAKYGEHWKKAVPTGQPADKKPANFAEADSQDGQRAIDAAIASVKDAELQAAMAGLFEPLLAAIESASTFEDALAAVEAAYPQMDTAQLQSLLARAMFGAETFGRVAAAQEQ